MLSLDDYSITKTISCGTDSITSCGSHPGVIYEERTRPLGANDVEKNPADLRQVLLDVQGLNCTGCEAKLYRALTYLPGVHNVRTSLVLSQAEFDLEHSAGPIDELARSITRLTGFTCQLLGTEGQEIDVIVDVDVRNFVERQYPPGVLQMSVTGKGTIRVAYDARVIGARTLLAHSFGTPLKFAPRRESSEIQTGKRHVENMMWSTLVSTIFTIPVLVFAWGPLVPRPQIYGSVSLACATVVQIFVAGPFYPSTLRALIFTHAIEADLLIVLSTSAAYIFSVVSFAYTVRGKPLETGEFFETSTLLVTLIAVGRLISAIARQRAIESVSVRSLQHTRAILCSSDARDDKVIDIRLLQYGDHFKVIPDTRIPTDGVVISGTTDVDESVVTGEASPVVKQAGSIMIAGTLNISGVVVVRLTHLPGENTISSIAKMVDRAKFSKPKVQALVDIIASYFVPVILLLCAITFAVWMAIGVGVRHNSAADAAANAITYAISVLIVSCPCAIGLAVPMVMVIASGVAAKHGIVFKSASTIETGRQINHVVFDKTGTLTHGQLSVVREPLLLCHADEALATMSVALQLCTNSKHPVSAAIADYLAPSNDSVTSVTEITSVTGQGMMGIVNGKLAQLGNSRWLSSDNHPAVTPLLAKGLTVCVLLIDARLVAIFGLSDSPRPEAPSIITKLHAQNIKVSMLSGDDAGAVQHIATTLNIPADRTKSRCTPQAKQEYLAALIARGDKVLFCGDGTNDAVALTAAHIGVHINTGSEIAQTAADVVLVRPHLGGILLIRDLSEAAFRRLCFNFAWAALYNLAAILLASGALVHARIPPAYAGLGELVSMLPVIAVALQLKLWKPTL